MRFDTRNMTPQQIADAERQLNERMMGRSNQPFTGLPKSSMQPQVQQVQLPMGGFPGVGQQQMPPMQPQVQQTARQLSAARQYLNAMQQYRQGGRQGVRPTYAQFKQPQPQPQQPDLIQLIQRAGGVGQQLGGMGMPPIGQPMSDPFKPQISGGPVGGGFGPGVNNYSAPQPIGQPPAGAFSGGQPMSDTFRRPSEQNLTPEQLADMEKRRLEQNALDNPGPTQEELARNTALYGELYGENGSQAVPIPFGIAGGGTGMPPIRPVSDPFKPQISGGPVGIAGGGTGMPPMPTKSLLEQLGYTPGQQLGGMPPMGGQPQQPQQGGMPVGELMRGYNPTQAQPMAVASGVGNMPDPFKMLVQRGAPQPMSDPFKPQISGGPVGQPMGVAGGVGTPPQPNQPPMPMKKGGFAAKPVWDKERPEDLNKPKSLSVKKKKAAKARAKAAGRPYPNLVDNMAAARKKGK